VFCPVCGDEYRAGFTRCGDCNTDLVESLLSTPEPIPLETRQVFIAQHPTEAYFVKDLLEAQGIDAQVRGEALFGMRGEAPVTPDTLPSVWVLERSQAEEALTIIAAYRRGDGRASASGQPWRCPRCGEELESQFTACWKCGSARPNGA
jgi:hypothetical protein